MKYNSPCWSSIKWISLKINLFSPWYSWKIAELALNYISLVRNLYNFHLKHKLIDSHNSYSQSLLYISIAAWIDWNPQLLEHSHLPTFSLQHRLIEIHNPYQSSTFLFQCKLIETLELSPCLVHSLSTCSLQHELIETLELSPCLCSLPIYMFIAAWTDWNPRVQSLSLFTTYLHVHCSMNWLKPSSSVLVFVHYLSTCSLQHELIATPNFYPH